MKIAVGVGQQLRTLELQRFFWFVPLLMADSASKLHGKSAANVAFPGRPGGTALCFRSCLEDAGPPSHRPINAISGLYRSDYRRAQHSAAGAGLAHEAIVREQTCNASGEHVGSANRAGSEGERIEP
jgi:hypothetical protein